MVGLLDAIPRKITVDRSEILNRKATVKKKRSLSMPKNLLKIGVSRKRSIRESTNHPMKHVAPRKRSVYASKSLQLKIRNSRKRSARDSKNIPFRNGITMKRSVNELDIPAMKKSSIESAKKKSSIEIEAFDSKSTIRPLTKLSVENTTAVSKNTSDNSTAISKHFSENSTAVDKTMLGNANITSNNTMEAHKNQTKQELTEVSNKTSDSQKTNDFPAVEDGLLQMTHNLLSDVTGFRENVADMKEATLSKHGRGLLYQIEVQKRPEQAKRNEVTGNTQSVNPLSVMVSKTRFEDYLINRFITYVCGKEC